MNIIFHTMDEWYCGILEYESMLTSIRIVYALINVEIEKSIFLFKRAALITINSTYK